MSEERFKRHERKHLTDEEINKPSQEDHDKGDCGGDEEESEGLARPASKPASGEPDPGH